MHISQGYMVDLDPSGKEMLQYQWLSGKIKVCSEAVGICVDNSKGD